MELISSHLIDDHLVFSGNLRLDLIGILKRDIDLFIEIVSEEPIQSILCSLLEAFSSYKFYRDVVVGFVDNLKTDNFSTKRWGHECPAPEVR